MDQSLDDVAINVRKTRSNRWAGRRLANSEATWAYLEAGQRLVERELLGEVEADKLTFRPLATLTGHEIVEEALANGRRLSRTPTRAMFRDRWPIFRDYMSDLVRFVLRGRNTLTNRVLDDAARDRLRGTARFSAAVHEVAYHDMKLVHGEPAAIRFQYLMTGLADYDHGIREALARVYDNSFAYWRAAYQSILDARGVSLRPGLTLDEFTMMLTSMAEGLGLRHIGAAGQKVIDHHRRRALLGKAVNLMIAGAIDPGDGRKVEDVVDELMAVAPPLPRTRTSKLAALRARAARRLGPK